MQADQGVRVRGHNGMCYIFDVNLDKSNSSIVDEKKADPERERRGKPAVRTTLLVMKDDDGDSDDRIHVHKGFSSRFVMITLTL